MANKQRITSNNYEGHEVSGSLDVLLDLYIHI